MEFFCENRLTSTAAAASIRVISDPFAWGFDSLNYFGRPYDFELIKARFRPETEV